MRRPRVRLILAYLALTGLLLGVVPSGVQAAPPQEGPTELPWFEVVACPWPLPEGATDGQDTICGYLHVPLRHSEPEGPSISLAVMILSATCADTAPDPIFWNAGGPGASTIDMYGYPLASSPLRCRRDLVLVDQRGIGHSIPAPRCPELDPVVQETMTNDGSVSAQAQALNACWQHTLDEGIDPFAFNTLESAADLDSLRQALGYEKINLYGVSYGSLLVLTALRDYSSNIRSLVLDGVLPPGVDTSGYSEWVGMVQALERVFQACAADPSCNLDYPDILSTYYSTVLKLDTSPTGDFKGPTYIGYSFARALFDLQYSSDYIPYIPASVEAMNRGHYWPLFASASAGGESPSVASQVIQCADLSFGYPPDDYMESVCALASATGLGPPAGASFGPPGTYWRNISQPVSSDVPALILNGGFDPITPPELGQFAAETLSNSYVLEFPTLSHGVAMVHECPDQVIAAFIDNPQAAPNSDCIAKMAPIQFRGPEELPELLSGGERVLGWGILNFVFDLSFRNESATIGLLLTIGALWIVSFGAVLVLSFAPLASLFSRILRRPQRPRSPLFVRLVLVWQALSAASLIALLGYLTACFGLMIEGPGPNYELSAVQPWVLPLPLLVGLTTILSLSSTWAGWRRRAWSRTRTVLHVILAVSAVCLNLILIGLGAIAGLM